MVGNLPESALYKALSGFLYFDLQQSLLYFAGQHDLNRSLPQIDINDFTANR